MTSRLGHLVSGWAASLTSSPSTVAGACENPDEGGGRCCNLPGWCWVPSSSCHCSPGMAGDPEGLSAPYILVVDELTFASWYATFSKTSTTAWLPGGGCGGGTPCVARSPPDLILLDIWMPDLDGISLPG